MHNDLVIITFYTWSVLSIARDASSVKYLRTVPTFATGPRKSDFITPMPAKTEIFLLGL